MKLPILRYEGPTHLVRTEDGLRKAMHDIAREQVVGFDTETPPTFRKGQVHAPSLVQIATRHTVHLFQLAQMDCSRVLAAAFENPQLVKAGVALSRDLSELQKLFPFVPANIVDLGEIAKRQGMKQTGLRNLAGLFLGGRITKGPQTSNWAQPDLAPTQIRYAATDAWACRELYVRFQRLEVLMVASVQNSRTAKFDN
ncbi:MAG TPA: 3'-5' exonuclease [Verrucomicrobiae bacterium]|nr:3'-5' exonuclease [Verrucomicrobiae bacterium]